MTLHSVDMGSSEMTLIARTLARRAPQIDTAMPGGLVPLVARHYVIDEYRMLGGWPQPVPMFDARTTTHANVDGTYVDNRPDASQITTGAILRWVSAEGYDQNAYAWNPIQHAYTPIDITTVASEDITTPYLAEAYDYRIGSERIYRKAIIFDHDSSHYMSLDLSGQISGQGFTAIMVCSAVTPENNYSVLFGPQEQSGDWYATTIQGQYLYTQTEDTDPQRGPAVSNGLNSNQPMYIAMVFSRPDAFLYAGLGPSSVEAASTPTGTSSSVNSKFYIGRAAGEDLDHNVSMALFDFAIYPNLLTPEEITHEFSLLSQIYGGDA